MEPKHKDEFNISPRAEAADWEATCLIYSDAKTSWKLERQQQQQQQPENAYNMSLVKKMNFQPSRAANGNSPSHTTTTATSNSPFTSSSLIGYGSIDLAITSVKEITFARYERSYGDESNAHYRFWTCGDKDGPPMIRLVFEYCIKNAEHYEEGVDGDDDDVFALPRHVTISLLSDYPPSWPRGNQRNKNTWIEWMNQQANDMLETTSQDAKSSFEVCSFLERRAIIEYFDLVNEDAASGNCLILFPDSVQEGASNSSSSGSKSNFNCYCYEMDSFIVSLQSQHAFMRHWPAIRSSGSNGGGNKQTIPISEYYTKQTLPKEARARILPFVLQWKQWVQNTKPCPICLECVAFADLVTINTCGHTFCRDCLSTYLSVKVKELHEHRDNPFRCPTCRYGMKVIGFVKKLLDSEDMDKVRTWYRHLKHPPCYSLTQCLSPKCNSAGSLRKQAIDSYLIFCEVCDGKWCELCLKRLHDNHNHHPLDNSERKGSFSAALPSYVDNSTTSSSPPANGDEECKAAVTAKFCQRYLVASDQAKRACEAKWPWIKLYANSRVHDAAVVDWLVQQGYGQVCPVCKTGVERIEGCFHISCTCGAHFCYECGEELHYPFYGTHHCWEEREQT